ncbi:MAG TPA: tetratricopeptide repeat protein [Methylomirabilota bacterium]
MSLPLVSLLVAALVCPLVAVPVSVHAQTTEADVYVAQAILDFDDRRYDEALKNLQEALRREPDHVEALYYAGVVNMALRRPGEAVPYLLQAQKRNPGDPSIAFQLGLAYFAQQRYEEAEPLLEQVFRTDPTIDALGYYVGFMRYRKKDYRGALAAFRAGRTTDPQLQQLTRFYTGLALAALGLPAQASAEVEQALRLAPGSALTGPAERLRDTIRAAAEQGRRLSAEVRFGLLYDDNVIVRPSPSSREPLVPILRDKRYDSVGELFGAQINYIWWQTETWESSVGYSFFGIYNNELPSFNITDHMLNGALAYKTSVAGMPLQAGLQYSWDMLYLDDDEFLRRNTATLTALLVESDRHLTQAFFRYQNKEFYETNPLPEPDEFRDADNFMGGVLHLLRFAQDAHLIKGGYQYDVEDAQGRNYSYHGHRFLLGGQYTLPWHGIRLYYDFDVHLRQYDHRNSLLPTYAPGRKRRADDEYNNTLRAELPFAGPTLWGHSTRMTLSASYQNTVAKSNIEVFEYTRNVYSLSLSWAY